MAPKPPPPKPPPKASGGKGAPAEPQGIKKFLDLLMGKKKEPPREKVGFGTKFTNALGNNWRGILGCLLPLALLSWQSEKGDNKKTVQLMWVWMFWFVLIQPVNVPVTGLIPIFLLPMAGVLDTLKTCGCYMNENTLLFILSAMLILLLNNSGVDRRIIISTLSSGDNCQFSASRLIFKSNTAAFFLSMFSNRLVVTSTMMQYLTPIFNELKTTAAKKAAKAAEKPAPKEKSKVKAIPPNYDEIRYVVLNSVQVASSIGSTAILHSATVTILFRAVWDVSPPKTQEYPDIFNYLQYSAFAFPVAFIMFVLNVAYHMILLGYKTPAALDHVDRALIKTSLLRSKAEIPRRVSAHEKLSVLFTLGYILAFFFRWNQWVDSWGMPDPEAPTLPSVKDATVAAIFVVALHALPKGFGFMKYFTAQKKSDLPPPKPESGILWWKFVDTNLNYGYFFTFGSSVALMTASQRTGLYIDIAHNIGKNITDLSWNTSIFVVCFVAALLTNIMTSMAACGIFLPFVISMAIEGQIPWPGRIYCGALGVGIASSFGFCAPFMYTPAYYCHHIGKVPIKKMAKYSFLSVWICTIVLWLALIVYAPLLFDPGDTGILPVDLPTTVSSGGATTAPD